MPVIAILRSSHPKSRHRKLLEVASFLVLVSDERQNVIGFLAYRTLFPLGYGDPQYCSVSDKLRFLTRWTPYSLVGLLITISTNQLDRTVLFAVPLCTQHEVEYVAPRIHRRYKYFHCPLTFCDRTPSEHQPNYPVLNSHERSQQGVRLCGGRWRCDENRA